MAKKVSLKLPGNMLIAQSGGPTRVINESLVGAILEAKEHKQIRKIYGSLLGIQGVLKNNIIDLGRESRALLENVAQTPSSALGSCRKKPTPEDCAALFSIMRKLDIRYFFYIGGNDTAETVHIINEESKKSNYELRCYHIPKTIDNDLRENDHTPGYASGAKFVACAFMGDNLDNRSLLGVKINIVMGRNAGFLTAASALARIYPDDGPHLIYLPERPFHIEAFANDVKEVYAKYGRCVVAASEGIVDKDGSPIASVFTHEVDAHGNVQLSGTGALGDLLGNIVKQKSNITRVRADTLGYLQRSFPAVVSDVDAREARLVGHFAVKMAAKGGDLDGSTAIRRKPGKKYGVFFERVSLGSVARTTRSMPANFIAAKGNDVTDAFIDYVRPLVGELPLIARLKCYKVSVKVN